MKVPLVYSSERCWVSGLNSLRSFNSVQHIRHAESPEEGRAGGAGRARGVRSGRSGRSMGRAERAEHGAWGCMRDPALASVVLLTSCLAPSGTSCSMPSDLLTDSIQHY